MSIIGDMEPEDAQDPSDPDPGAVAFKFFEDLREITQDPQRKHFRDLPELERWVVTVAFLRLLTRLKREHT